MPLSWDFDSSVSQEAIAIILRISLGAGGSPSQAHSAVELETPTPALPGLSTGQLTAHSCLPSARSWLMRCAIIPFFLLNYCRHVEKLW